ncbi:hypothetical protein [Aldersonia kunmingensis]|uniref:hypothetical protein n=1 Tax=Aldersonia kunmingensis TaxID=408066 RepID=UPI000836F7F7|nr:hypothetical protein [Aldersonia kunmingensis]
MSVWKPLIVVSAAAACLGVVPPPAVAEEPPVHLAGATWTFAHNPLLCGGGYIRVGMSSGQPSGWAVVGMNVYFVGPLPLLNINANNSCTINATFHWRNDDTGAQGSLFLPMSGAGFNNQMPSSTGGWFHPGPGRVSAFVTTDAAHYVSATAQAPIR